MTEKKKRRIAHTEDRIKSPDTICAYPACGSRLSTARLAEGGGYCEEECYYAHLAERDDSPDPEEDES